MGVALRYRLEYAAVRVAAGVLRALPAFLVGPLVAGLARWAAMMGRSRVREAERRIREALGPDLPADRVQWIARESLRHLILNVVELLRTPPIDAAWVGRNVVTGGLGEIVRDHVPNGSGFILVIPHLGNWDLAASYTVPLGFPIFTIAANQRNPLTDAWIKSLRASRGIDALTRDDHTVRAVLKRLRAGGALAILPDLRSRTPGVVVDFFGKPANLMGGLGMFAKIANVPVICGYVFRLPGGRHEMHFELPICPDPSLDRDADALRITQAAIRVIETGIRAHPEQYFWYNRRWVLEPVTSGSEPEVSSR